MALPPARPRGPMDAPASEDSSGSTDERVRKFQKTGEHGSRLRKTSASNLMSTARPSPADPSAAAAAAATAASKPPHRPRAKAPLGPRERPHDFSKQRVTSLSGHAPPADTRSFPSTAAHAPSDSADTSASYDFLPAVNFDDFANSLAYEPTLSDFPVPASFSTAQPASIGASTAANTTTMHAFTATPTDARPARSNSFMQRFTQSGSRKAGPPPPTGPPPPPPDAAAATQPTTNMAIRTRRQSQFPAQVPTNTAARGPRKSLGPGMVPTGIFENRSEVPRLTPDSTAARPGRSSSLSKGGRRDVSAANQATTTAVPRVPNAARSTKARSFHPSSRQTSGQHLSADATTPDPTSMPLHQSRSPAKSPAAQNDFTPTSSANKRQSTVPHHFGLGARTISPTDARRLRRLSTNPNTPGGPVGPPTPLADFPFDEQVFSQSPAISIRKSETPSSARETPELTRKSYASGISISSNSSINSLKAAGSSIPMRTNPTLTSSRLPTPKTRNVHSSAAGEEEDVPPVPAIPKAFESPKDPDRTSFTFSLPVAKTNTPSSQEPSSTAGANSSDTRNAGLCDSDSSKTDAMGQSTGSIRHRRGVTLGAGPEAPRTPTVQHSSKKNLQPIRLPPLNLLPLGTPFNTRLSSFPAPSDGLDQGTVTPPPKRHANKTPSTPMTASKTSFFSTSGHAQHDYFGKHVRSSSSAVNLRGTETSHPGLSSMPIPTLNPGRQATTPFSSNSLPKGSGEFTRLQPRASGEYQSGEADVELQTMKAAEPRPLKKTNTSDSVQTSTSTDPDTPSSGNSLRRKLSLSGWRRNGSKANSQAAQNQQARKPGQKPDESAPPPPKHGEMPPPRLPTSSTWSGAPDASPTPTTGTSRLRPSLDFARRKPAAATTGNDTNTDKSKDATNASARAASGAGSQTTSQPVTKSGSSLLNPMQRMLGTKASSNVLRSRNLDPNLDRDDMLADEEMKKLASKRKDFEHAARDVDELRKRAKPQERVTPAQALQMVNLNIFERGEIIDYKEVYFCGTKSAKKHVGDLNAQTANFGYDDDRGDYNIVFGDHLAYRYEVVDLLGKGSFGQVVRCVDHKTGGLVAIKIIRNKKRFHQQALVEVNILQKLREWDPDNKHSMINFTQSFYFRGHLCISTELLGMNLYEFIKAHEFKGFSIRLIRRFCKQMLASLTLLKTQRVIHCDLKPENILLAHPLHSEIKVIDFGSSCFENEKVYTYIQSRFYRSPEVILGMSYGLPIDMWSLGCILAELLTGYPIFPGENEQEQLACIMEIFGPPEKHLIEKSSRKKLFFDSLGKPRVTVSTKGRRRRPSSKTLQQALKCDDEAFLDFISRCLRWDPERRMKPDEAMHHEFITGTRRNVRQRMPISSTSSSPVKRVAPAPAPQARVRPLPEPPATSVKNSSAANPSRDRVPSSSSSPVKAAPPRRHSTVSGPPGPGGTGVKRAANGAPLNATSSLPRAAQRSVSGKPDLASAAAVASLQKTR